MALSPINEVSPSLAWRLSVCAHEVGLSHAHAVVHGGIRRNSSASALGNAAHKVLEAALSTLPLADELSDEWFEERWKAAIEHEQARCTDPGPPEGWWRFSIVKRGTRKAARELRHEVAESGASPIVEREMRSSTCSLWGRPDIVLAYEDGTAEIIDFKTGEHIESQPSERELDQLHLYAFLVEETEHLEAVSLRIIRCNGQAWRGNTDAARVRRCLEKGLEGIATFNGHLADTTPLARTGDACSHCSQAARCEVVWASPPDGFVGVAGRIERLSDEAGSISLEILDGDEKLIVVGCPAGGAEAGGSVRIAHLRPAGERTYRWLRDRTAVEWISL